MNRKDDFKKKTYVVFFPIQPATSYTVKIKSPQQFRYFVKFSVKELPNVDKPEFPFEPSIPIPPKHYICHSVLSQKNFLYQRIAGTSFRMRPTLLKMPF